jgi:TP901 family phage tail tape measure protein
MADVQSNIHVNIDTSDALASLKLLQRQISAFHTQMAKSGTAASAVAANQAQNLMNSINATGQFQASMRTVKTSTEAFTESLEKNKLTSREYFRYTGAATKTFGRLFRSEFETINKVARERVKDIQTQYIKLGRGANGALQAIAVRPLTLDMKNLGTQTAMAAQKQQLLNQLLKQGSTNLLNFGKNTQWAGRQLMVGFTVPLVMLGTQAGKTFMKLEEQAIRFKRVYGEMFTTQEETDAMVKQIQLLAKEYTKYGVAVEDTMKMAADAAAMGKMGADLTAQVAQATRLAVLGGVEQTQALETTISVTNAFGVATEELAKKIDFLNAVENQTVVSIEDLTIAIPKAGPVVQQLGGDVEDLAFFLTAMKEGGINASEGANALKSGLASLINPSEKASKMLMGLGVNIKGIVEANKGDVKSTVVEFAAALDTLDPLNRARAIEQLFGKFQFSRLSTLFQNVTAQGTQASRVLELTKATTEELAILSERELGRIENTTTYKFKKSIEDLKVTLAPVGEQFLKALTPIVEFAAKILDKFNDLGDGSKKFLTILTVALGAVGPVALMAFGLLANGVANIIKLFATMRSGFQKAGSSTQILGQQTDYLTQQQLEASAIAASLDQVHQKLRQTFTSEASAVNSLALAYRNAIASQAGFTGPVGRTGKMRGPAQSQQYATGVTKVPGTGNKDTVPAMLTPGEAVIPAGAAQDPANKPVIARMIAGQTVQGFNQGTHKVSLRLPPPPSSQAFEKTYNAQSAQGARGVQEFLNLLTKNPDGTLTYTDPKTKKEKTFSRSRLVEVMEQREGEGKLTATKLNRSLIRENASNRSSIISRLKKVYNEKNAQAMLEEQKTIEKVLKDRGLPTLTDEQKKNAFQTHASHISDERGPDGKKIWKASTIAPDSGYINQYVNTVKGDLGKELLGLSDEKLKSYGIDREELKKIVAGNHPRSPESIKTFRGAARYQIDTYPKLDKIYQAHMVDAGVEHRFKTGMYAGAGLRSFAEMFPDDKGVIRERSQSTNPLERFSPEQEARLKRTATLAAQTKSGQLPASNFGKLIAPTTGFSFDVPGVGGLYDGPNGRVFVKPMMSELDALAEKRATDFARQVHGLDTPEQKISTMIDPSDPEGKRKIIVLESKYDPKFAKPETKFTREQYFRQLVAANLRGDKDLKMGNLGGNILTDVGTAGVFDKATSVTKDGIRVLSAKMPSMLEMAEKNLKGVAGPQAKNSPNWFANVTQKVINQKGYTADDYDRDMKNEIKKIQGKAEAFVQKIPLNDPLRPAYVDMLRRINEGAGENWRALYDKHRSIAIKPNEVVLDKDGKPKKPKSEPMGKTKTAKRSADSRKISATQAASVRNVTSIRGRADAPTILNPALAERMAERKAEESAKKQAMAEADARKRYGTVAPTASQKSMRRKEEQMQRQGKPLVALTKQLSAPVSVFQKVMDKATRSVQKNTVASRVLEKFKAGQEKKAAAKAAGTAKPRMGAGGAAMGIAGMAMVGSMIPGAVGEMFQKLMMPLMGLSMILPMVQSKFSALAVGVGALVAAYAYQRMQFDKAQNAALELTNAMGVGKDAMIELSKSAGKVSAGEVMDRRRQDKFNILPIQTGKSTFGQSFVKSELGKQMIGNIGKAGGTGKALDSQTAQLQNAVMSGAMSMDQAKSVAASLASQLGDYSFGIKIIGRLTELLGPNGENLENNPYEVRVKAMEQTRTRVATANQNMAKAGGFGQDVVRGVGSVAAGAGAGAGIGAIAGQILIPIPGVGAAIGASVGTALGAIGGGIMGYKDRGKRIGEATGASVAMDKMALEQNQEMLDSYQLQMEGKIELLRTQGKINEAVALENKYYENRDKLLTEARNTKNTILNNYDSASGDVKDAYETGVGKAITKKYKGTMYEDMVPLATTQISDSQLTDKQKMSLRLEMESGGINPDQMIGLFETFKDKKSQQAVLSIVSQFGGKYAAETLQVVRGFGDNQALKQEYTLQLKDIKTSKEAEDFQDFYRRLTTYDNVIPAKISVDYFLKNPTVAATLEETIDTIEASKGEQSIKFYADIIGGKALAALNSDAAYFQGLDKAQEVIYTTALAYQLQLEGDPDQQAAFKAWQALNVGKGPTDYINFAAANAQQITKQSSDTSLGINTGAETPAENKVQSSPLDELLKKLRDVRKNSIQVTKGFDASFKSLNKLFGGKKTIEVFSGIENDMRRLGAGEDLIELIVGMDPEEFEKQKNKLFKFKNGEIVALKDGARSIGDALQSIALGDFVSTQDRMVKNIGNQNTALARLKAAGVDGSVALEMVANASDAAAIANNKLSDEQLKKVISAANKGTKALRQFAAVQDIEGNIGDIEDRAKLYTKLAGDIGKYSQAEIEAILNNPALVEGLLTGASNFAEGLKKELEQKQIELNIQLLTISGLQDIFDTGLGNAMEAFDVKETALRLDFDINNKSLTDAIKKAEEQIALNQEKIRKEEIGLKEIQDQEDKINDQYDKRLDAIDEIEKANASISQQQKGQLTLAESLTSGDIAAAARAAQEIRAQQAADNVVKQKDALEKSREYELLQIRSKDGRSRIEIEKEIKKLQDEIYEIEQKSLEPNRETLRLNQLALDKAIEGVDVLGRTREQWEKIKNAVDLAKISSAQFIKQMEDAINSQQRLINAYNVQKTDTDAITPAQVVDKTKTADIDINDMSDYIILDPKLNKKTTPKSVFNGFNGGGGGSTSFARMTNTLSKGGMVDPKYFAVGGFAKGTDTVPAMLTPGEFIMSKYAVDAHGVDTMRAINNGQTAGGAVYNNTYTLTVNAKTNANPNEIAQAVMSTIKKVDDRRIRGVSLNAR